MLLCAVILLAGIVIEPLFNTGSSRGGKLVLCLIASIVLMTIDYRFAHLDTTRTVLTTTLYPLQCLVDLPSRTYRWARRRWLNALP
jgi:hypothetical protein